MVKAISTSGPSGQNPQKPGFPDNVVTSAEAEKNRALIETVIKEVNIDTKLYPKGVQVSVYRFSPDTAIAAKSGKNAKNANDQESLFVVLLYGEIASGHSQTNVSYYPPSSKITDQIGKTNIAAATLKLDYSRKHPDEKEEKQSSKPGGKTPYALINRASDTIVEFLGNPGRGWTSAPKVAVKFIGEKTIAP
jgi:hypothetical protein